MRFLILITINVFALLIPSASYASTKLVCHDLVKEIAANDKSGISVENPYQALLVNGAYFTVVNKYLSEYGTDKEDELAGFYASDALISMALENSDSPPLPKESIVLAEEKDIVTIDLFRALSEINPNIWSKEISSKYGEANLCILSDAFNRTNEIYDFQKRYISTMVLMGDFHRAIESTKEIKIRSISVSEFSQVGEVFVGIRKPIEAATFIKVLSDNHGLGEEKLKYWSKFIHKFIDIENYSEKKKENIAYGSFEIIRYKILPTRSKMDAYYAGASYAPHSFNVR